MSTSSVTRAIVIRNPQGLHARPAEMFARMAMSFESRIELVHESQRVDGKSILHLLTLGARAGTRLILEAEGRDAEAAADALARLVESGFGNESPEKSETPFPIRTEHTRATVDRENAETTADG
jgi:phosphotransferase system HPr (HPr) family protein